MATTADYMGKNCPYCGAIDSIETDEARGEAACVECATVLAMGLEENVATRWEKDVTFADVDKDDWREGEAENGDAMGRAKAKNAAITREEAAAAAAGFARRPSTSSDLFDTAKYGRTRLHPNQARAIEALYRLSRRHDEGILQDATAMAKRFVGHRRERGVRVEHQAEVAACCVMLAAELHGLPIPISEMRVLDPSLKSMEVPRQQIIEETNLRAEMAKFEKKMVPNLIHHYLQLLQLPLGKYEQPCLALFHAIRSTESKADERVSDMALLVEAEKVVMAILLARTAPSIRWAGKPPAPTDASSEPPPETVYASFASSAHLPPARVLKIMRAATRALPVIEEEFNRLILRPEFAAATVHKTGEALSQPKPSVAPTTAVVSQPEAPSTGEAGTTPVGEKRDRSRSASPPAPPSARQ